MGDEMEENTEDTRPRTLDTAPAIDPRELNDLLDFAAKGGLGQGVAYVPVPPSLSLSRCSTFIVGRRLGEQEVAWLTKG